MQLDFSHYRFPNEITLLTVCWYLRSRVSTRDLEEMLEDRGIPVDHSSIDKWVNKFGSQIDTIVKKKRKPTGKMWWMDETYVKVKGLWKYLYSTADKDGQTLDELDPCIEIKQSKYMNNIVEKDHRGIKMCVKHGQHFIDFHTAQNKIKEWN